MTKKTLKGRTYLENAGDRVAKKVFVVHFEGKDQLVNKRRWGDGVRTDVAELLDVKN